MIERKEMEIFLGGFGLVRFAKFEEFFVKTNYIFGKREKEGVGKCCSDFFWDLTAMEQPSDSRNIGGLGGRAQEHVKCY